MITWLQHNFNTTKKLILAKAYSFVHFMDFRNYLLLIVAACSVYRFYSCFFRISELEIFSLFFLNQIFSLYWNLVFFVSFYSWFQLLLGLCYSSLVLSKIRRCTNYVEYCNSDIRIIQLLHHKLTKWKFLFGFVVFCFFMYGTALIFTVCYLSLCLLYYLTLVKETTDCKLYLCVFAF